MVRFRFSIWGRNATSVIITFLIASHWWANIVVSSTLGDAEFDHQASLHFVISKWFMGLSHGQRIKWISSSPSSLAIIDETCLNRVLQTKVLGFHSFINSIFISWHFSVRILPLPPTPAPPPTCLLLFSSKHHCGFLKQCYNSIILLFILMFTLSHTASRSEPESFWHNHIYLVYFFCFLAWQDIPGSHCTFSTPDLEWTISSKSPCSWFPQ